MTGVVVDERGPWAIELTDLATAASGGLLFGIPMLFTMEVWWTGSHTTPLQAAGMLALTSLPLVILNLTDGFRSTKDVRVRDAAMDSAEALALGVLLVTVVLAVFGEITPATPLPVALGKVAYEAFPFCLGIGVAHHFLRGGRDGDGEGGAEGDDEGGAGGAGTSDGEPDGRRVSATVADLGATAIGATFVALNIAPTDEVPLITSALGPLGILALVAASLVVSYGIVFVAAFANQDKRHQQTGAFQRPVAETMFCYLVALACAAGMLLLFQRLAGPWTLRLDQVIVLGLPATIGGAAGRLAI